LTVLEKSWNFLSLKVWEPCTFSKLYDLLMCAYVERKVVSTSASDFLERLVLYESMK